MLKFYIYSLVITSLVMIISGLAMKERLKREGYKYTKKYSLFELIHGFLPALIPIFNIFLAFIFIFKYEELFAKMKEAIESKN